MATKTFTVSKQYFADIGSGDANPGDLHIVIGQWAANSYSTRALLYAPVSFSGMTNIVEARLYMRADAPASGFHAKGTSTATIHAARKTADWSETAGGVSSAVDEIWGGDGDAWVESNYAGVAGGDTVNLGSLSNDTWYFVPITGIVQAWFSGSPNYGLLLYNATSESNSNFAKQFSSRHDGGEQPYIWIDYGTNTAPNVPVNMSPTNNAVIHTGTTIAYTLTHSDPDGSGDNPTGAEYFLFNDASVTIDHWTSSGLTGNVRTSSRTLPGGYYANTHYRWRARTKDESGVWGPFSGLHRFRPNTAPRPPTGLAEETDTLTPQLSGSFSDPDPNDTMAAVVIEVYNNATGATMWQSGDLVSSGSTWSQIYSGATLAWGTTYKWHARVKDSMGAYGGWSAYRTFTTTQPSGPTLSPRNTTHGSPVGGKQANTIPNLTITYTEQFKNHEVFIYTVPVGGAAVYSFTGGVDYALTNSKIQVPSGLSSGTVYYWRARVKLNDGTMTGWGGFVGSTVTASFYTNALPTAPTELQIIEDTGRPPVIRDSDGVYIVTTRTPVFLAKYNDPDLLAYNDLPGNRDIEVYNDATGALFYSRTDFATVFGDPVQYRLANTAGASTTLAAASVAGATNIKVVSVTNMAIGDTLMIGPVGNTQEARKIVTVGTAGSGGTGITLDSGLSNDHASGEAVVELTAIIALDTIYKIRTRFKDNTGTYGAWSSYLRFKATSPSTVTSVTPTGTITTPAITIAWNHTGSGGKAQGKYRVEVIRTADESVVYDTGYVTSSVENHKMPVGYLKNNEAYTVQVEAVDTDNM